MNPQENEILAKLKNMAHGQQILPDPPSFPYAGNPLEDFAAQLESFDGKSHRFKTREEAIAWLETQAEMDRNKNRLYSSADGIEGNVTEEDLSDLRNAEKLNTCVTEGVLGVGETGSVWVTNASLKHAVTALLCRHLFILLDCARLVGGIHEAYDKINLEEQQYGSFFSGPSATADIEAVHITGAQGPLALTVLLYNCG